MSEREETQENSKARTIVAKLVIEFGPRQRTYNERLIQAFVAASLKDFCKYPFVLSSEKKKKMFVKGLFVRPRHKLKHITPFLLAACVTQK